MYGTDGIINLDVLIAPFKGDKCRSLVGKPKLFFIQVKNVIDNDSHCPSSSLSWIFFLIAAEEKRGHFR